MYSQSQVFIVTQVCFGIKTVLRKAFYMNGELKIMRLLLNDDSIHLLKLIIIFIKLSLSI